MTDKIQIFVDDYITKNGLCQKHADQKRRAAHKFESRPQGAGEQMIDEKFLEGLADVMRIHPSGTHVVFVEKKNHGAWTLDAERLAELIRLARLGLWAEKHGVAAVKIYAELEDWGYDHSSNSKCDYGVAAEEALAALPKDE